MTKPAQSPRPRPPRSLRSDATRVLDECPAWHLRLAARKITVFLDAHLAPSSLTTAQFGLMSLLAAARDDTLGALAQRAGLDQSTLSRNLDTLARLGWAEITTSTRDRRKRAAWLTEAGARKLAAAMPLWRAAQEAVAGVVDVVVARQAGESAQASRLNREN
ncbi:MarR family transcriptional regulator [Oleomonas cavernae]|uniref:MarR family transcriptional regulator n=1 Tax=Oleomonas cavernae TaxID=2320859 RepID=A0A418WFB6_9PROT|nr:MarR family winged helix-turn-helix transcriptional regulator [Oleomonas cavernae]RJF88711.1 MarR family transcriptional regulator [Oleomonas cavernae]